MVRNVELAVIHKKDPNRVRTRVVLAAKGKGRKVRPRNSNRDSKQRGPIFNLPSFQSEFLFRQDQVTKRVDPR
jgi:hypothetical protein